MQALSGNCTLGIGVVAPPVQLVPEAFHSPNTGEYCSGPLLDPEKGLRPLLYMQVLQMCVRIPLVAESAKRGRPVIYMQVLQNCAGAPLFPEPE